MFMLLRYLFSAIDRVLEEEARVLEGLRSWCSDTNIPEYTPAMQDNDSAMTAAAASLRLSTSSLGRKATADPPAKVKRSGISTASVLSADNPTKLPIKKPRHTNARTIKAMGSL